MKEDSMEIKEQKKIVGSGKDVKVRKPYLSAVVFFNTISALTQLSHKIGNQFIHICVIFQLLFHKTSIKWSLIN